MIKAQQQTLAGGEESVRGGVEKRKVNDDMASDSDTMGKRSADRCTADLVAVSLARAGGAPGRKGAREGTGSKAQGRGNFAFSSRFLLNPGCPLLGSVSSRSSSLSLSPYLSASLASQNTRL